jgi:hypothetical protein
LVTDKQLTSALNPGKDLDLYEPNLFFWVPEDASGPARSGLIASAPGRALQNLQGEKNGSWQLVMPERGRVRLVVFGPIRDIPTFHAMYREGHDTYMVRDKGLHLHPTGKRCNKVRFWRSKRYPDGIYLPDPVARGLLEKGAIDEPAEWDDPSEARILAEEAAEPKEVELPREGERVRTVVPFKEDNQP